MIILKMNLSHTQFLLNLKGPPKLLFPIEIWGGLPEAAKQMIIEYNKKIKVTSPEPYLNGAILNQTIP